MSSDSSGSTPAPISPTKLAHFVLRTSPDRLQTMVEWYQDLLHARIVFQNPFSCFMTYDDEHHRVAILGIPGLAERTLNAVGVDHMAFTYASLGDLIATYEGLAARGVTPIMPIHHGPTLSMYYLDPDKNQVELQIDVFASDEEIAAYLAGGAYGRNPIGVMYDAAELAKRYREGVPEAELKKPLEGPPPGPGDWAAH